MAADDFTADTFGQNAFITKRTAVLPAADVVRQVKFPSDVRLWSVQFYKADKTTKDTGKIASSGTEAGAIGDHVIIVEAGGFLGMGLGQGTSRVDSEVSVYISSGTGLGYAHFLFQKSEP